MGNRSDKELLSGRQWACMSGKTQVSQGSVMKIAQLWFLARLEEAEDWRI